MPLDFDFFKRPIYRYRQNEDFIVRLIKACNSSGKVILCSADTTATDKLLDIFLWNMTQYLTNVMQQR